MNPTCEKTQEKILEAIGTAWDPGKESDLAVHLQICPACRELWEDCERIRVGMDALEPGEGPSELTAERILKAAREQQAHVKPIPEKAGRRFLTARPVQIAAMVALIVGVGLYSQKWLKDRGNELAPADFKTAPVKAPVTAPAPETAPPPAPAANPQPAGDAAKTPAPAGPAAPGQAVTAPSVKDAVERFKAPAPAKPDLKEKAKPAEPLPSVPEGAGGGLMDQPSELGKVSPSGAITTERRTVEEDQAPAAKGLAAPAPSAQKPAAPAAKAMQAPAATTAAPGAPAPVPPADGEQQREAEAKKESEEGKVARRKLVASAKSKINIGDYQGALQELLRAERQGSSAEIARLIQLCRDKLKPEAIPAEAR